MRRRRMYSTNLDNPNPNLDAPEETQVHIAPVLLPINKELPPESLRQSDQHLNNNSQLWSAQ